MNFVKLSFFYGPLVRARRAPQRHADLATGRMNFHTDARTGLYATWAGVFEWPKTTFASSTQFELLIQAVEREPALEGGGAAGVVGRRAVWAAAAPGLDVRAEGKR